MLTWDEFTNLIARWANVPITQLHEETDLTRDLGLDSLALEQVLSGMEGLIPHYSLTEFWRYPTLKALYARYCQEIAPQNS